ncbi:MAG: twin-arginine translocation signal domain-containing protein [Gammaproteobacteria bacterium]|nr:twin-arginine translocation signal domain-containing protein [Gammaproteobacteria bacterium]
MKKTGKKLDKNRRDFIKKSTLVGAGVAASTFATGEAVAAVSNDDDQVQGNKGYQLTDHVLEYYKSAAS